MPPSPNPISLRLETHFSSIASKLTARRLVQNISRTVHCRYSLGANATNTDDRSVDLPKKGLTLETVSSSGDENSCCGRLCCDNLHAACRFKADSSGSFRTLVIP